MTPSILAIAIPIALALIVIIGTVIINKSRQLRGSVNYSVITDNSSPCVQETTAAQSESNTSFLSNYL